MQQSETEKNILSQIIKSSPFKLLVAIVVYFVFKSPIEDAVTSLIASSYFSAFRRTELGDIFILLGLVLIYLVYARRINDKYKNSQLNFYLTLFIAIIYTYYQLSDNIPWSFTSSLIFPSFYYLDLIYVLLAGHIILFAEDFTESPIISNNNNAFLIDQPISGPELDKYGRKQFAAEISRKIIDTNILDTSVAIGIDGIWGSGKTSFLKMIRHFLAEYAGDNVITIDFHPWKSSNPNQIVLDFFQAFSERLANFDGNLSSEVSRYAESLSIADPSTIGKIWGFIKQIPILELSKESRYLKINKSLKKSTRKLSF